MSNHNYTVWIAWNSEESEEVDFAAPANASVKDVLAKAVAVCAVDYQPGWTIIGIVDNTTNEVIYNPTNAPTTTTWQVTV